MQDLEPKPVILLIADISGYTEFMLSHQKALVHSQMVVGELINTIVESVGPSLEVAKLEGDAVFCLGSRNAPGLPGRQPDPGSVSGCSASSRCLITRSQSYGLIVFASVMLVPTLTT